MISCIQLRENLTAFFSCLSRTKAPFENVNSSMLSLTISATALKPHKKCLLSIGIAGVKVLVSVINLNRGCYPNFVT